MPRYVLANRLAGKRTDSAKRGSRAAVDEALARLKGVKIISDHRPDDDRHRRIVILEVGKAKIERLRAALPPDVILEPVIERSLHSVPIVKLAAAQDVTAPPAAPPCTVTVTGAGGPPLTGIKVVFYMRDRRGKMWAGHPRPYTNGQAVAKQRVPKKSYAVAFVRPVPYDGFWSMVVEAPASGSTISCAALPSAGGGWWHAVMGIDVTAAGRGAGINVGVIDTGCGPHPNLTQVTLVGKFVNGQQLPGSQAIDGDSQGHGTHTTGIIGAQPTPPAPSVDFCGIAPDCNLFHARSDFTAHDDAHAIDVLSRDHHCDLINMSFGSGTRTVTEEDAIQAALERGTLCICSAGNFDGQRQIDYPAAFSQCVAVSSIGQVGHAPAGTWAACLQPTRAALIGHKGLFLCALSKYGTGLTCAGPGVGIISTVPDQGGATGLYVEQSGTSEASAAVCGALAVILSNNAAYNALPRDRSRAEKARKLLIKHCKKIGLAKKYVGHGLPHV